jgi:hypothetical protein
MNNVVIFDPVYMKHLKMWRENRWRFSGKIVNLTIKQSEGKLTPEEKYEKEIMDRIVEEHNGQWLDEYIPHKKNKKKG